MTPEQEIAIREGHAAGRSQNAIGRELGIPPHVISRWSKRVGLIWTGSPIGAAQQAERIRQARRDAAERTIADVLALRELMWSEEEPTARDLRDIAAAMERVTRVHVYMDDAVSDSSTAAATSMLARLGVEIEEYVTSKYGSPDVA